jgi:hypothetical protein
VRICTELDATALSDPGVATKMRIWVEGDPRPIQIRLHNDSPGVVRLKGGDDQIIHMGCRLHRQVRRKITSIGPGEPRLVVRPYSPLPKREAAEIAAALAPRLEEIEARFTLCVTSDPKTGARFLMRPQAVRKWTIEGITTGDLAVVYRGLYAYRMSQGFKVKRCENPENEPCALIDLVDDPQPVFHCDLTRDACTRKPAPLPAECRDYG